MPDGKPVRSSDHHDLTWPGRKEARVEEGSEAPGRGSQACSHHTEGTCRRAERSDSGHQP